MVVAICINQPSIIISTTNQFHIINPKTPFSTPSFCHTLKQSETGNWKLVRLKKKVMAAGGDEVSFVAPVAFEQEHESLIGNNDDVAFNQTLGGIHTFANHLSKWIVAVTYSLFILLRHDAFALWTALGSVINIILSVVLKKILKQERPVSGVSSGHGMPSSHAQSIFFTVVIVFLSVVQWQGLNGVTAIFGLLILALGSYFSWLRVSQRYHTTSQVVVGGVVGSTLSALWFWAWEASVHKAYDSSLWVQILLFVGTAGFCLGFTRHVFLDWIKGED